MIGFCTSPRFIEHDTGPNHPERPDRIRAIFKAVRESGLIDSPNPLGDFPLNLQLPRQSAIKLLELKPAPADESWLLLVHQRQMIEHIRSVCAAGGGILDQSDTPVCPASFEVAVLAAGAGLACCDAVMEGRVGRAFAAVRPPGHHAEPDRAMGFCLFNNIAVAARYLQKKHGVQTVAIVDFDVHHGNGTQAIFQDDPSVLYISLHQHPATLYPGTGYDWETGEGAGRGSILNLPMQPGAEDADYLAAISSRVIPKLDEFRPQILLISAGFDAHRDDPLSAINLSEDCFASMTRMLVESAEKHCGGRLISFLEGGYNLRSLARSVVRHLIAMA